MIPVLDSRAMKAADRAAIAGGVPSERLMENAATGLVEELLAACREASRVAVVCGPGNNGGDGLAAARLLAVHGVSASVFTLREPETYRGDAAENAARAREIGLELSPLTRPGVRRGLGRALSSCDAIIDALFGTGLSRSLEGDAARAVAAINRVQRSVVSADLPSGLSADTGDLLGPCVRADLTVAFAAPKRCHVLPPARSYCGRVVVKEIGISRDILARQKTALWISEPRDVADTLAPRPADSHKGDFGRLAIVAGSRGKTGAAALAARGALRAGAGLVTVFCPASLELAIIASLPEAMTRGLPDRGGALAEEAGDALAKAFSEFDAVAVGPGLGTSSGVVAVLRALLRSRLPLVCDADALNAFPGDPGAFARRPQTILTPHPGEAGRLLASSAREIQADRLAAATTLAKKSRAVIVLKGWGSLIATPRGRVTVNPTGSPLMATAGSGDVLTGTVGALLAAGMEAERAALVGAYLHGAAGERLERDLGDAGLLASELADAIPRVRAELRARREA